MPKLKICFYVPFYPLIKGGAEYQAKIIALGLQKNGFEVIYISGGHNKNDCVTKDGFKVYQLQVKSSVYAKLNLYKAHMKEVCRILDKEKPKIVYQRILNTFTYRLSVFTKKHNIPFVLHIADNYSVTFQEGQRGRAKKKLFLKIIANGSKIICQTKFQRKKVEELGGAPTIIANMHPVLLESPLAKINNRIVWIGNARPVKQLELYLELAKRLSSTEYDFHIIGNVPESSYGKALLEGVECSSNVIYHGAKNNEFINPFLKESALLVNTSSSEGFSNTFIQSWMCGTPVLALNSDPDDVMREYGIGTDCKGEFDKMPLALEQLLTNEQEYSLKCKKAIKTANALFSVESNLSKFNAVLEHAMVKTN